MILVIDDDSAIRTSLGFLLKREGFAVSTVSNPHEAFLTLQKPIELVLLDMNFSVETSGQEGLDILRKIKDIKPELPVILMTGWGTIELAVKGMKNGATDFINKPWDNDYLIKSIKTSLKLSQSIHGNDTEVKRVQLDKDFNFEGIIGQHKSIINILKTVGRVSATDASILITGESGTGKELIAEAIHKNSTRKHKAFVKVNLGGISSSLFESEMFGHKKGAFTDARSDRIGRFELANKGTIFLDEIGDLDLASQVKLLRVLQDRTYEVLGDSKTRTVDVRVICATNRDLAELVQEGKFREDLFYRINLITINLPSLRDRSEDIVLLAEHFTKNLQGLYKIKNLKISQPALLWLKNLALPGNIRQLKNLVERVVLVSESSTLNLQDFQQAEEHQGATNKLSFATGLTTLEEMEKSMILNSMELYNSNISKVAIALGLSRGTMYRKLVKYKIPHDAQK